MNTSDKQAQDLKFECTNCGQHIEVPEQAIGDVIDCPGCGEKVEVPTRETMQVRKAKRVEVGKNAPPNPNLEAHFEAGRVRDKAQQVQTIANVLFVICGLAMIFAIVSAIKGEGVIGLAPMTVAGSAFGLGLWLTIVAQIMHVRAVGLRIVAGQK
jgi:DNA-directed RNA polymerase subunit RPC12/RpoP